MSNVKFFPILADLSVAGKQHKLPPEDSWKAPQNGGVEATGNYVNGVSMANWGMGVESADGVMSYFATQDPQKYHLDTAYALALPLPNIIEMQQIHNYKSLIYIEIAEKSKGKEGSW